MDQSDLRPVRVSYLDSIRPSGVLPNAEGKDNRHSTGQCNSDSIATMASEWPCEKYRGNGFPLFFLDAVAAYT
jgi:hypothetical protein